MSVRWRADDPGGATVSDPTEHSVAEDSEVDFDDEQEDDQEPLDEVEAREVGANLDDPEAVADDDDLG